MCIFSIFPKIQLYLFISFCTWIFSSATHWCFFLQYWFEFLQILEKLINENENVDSQSRIGFQLSAHHKIWNSGKENKSPSKSAFQDQGVLVTGTHHWTCEHASSNKIRNTYLLTICFGKKHDFINPEVRKDKDLLSVHLGVGMEKSLYMCEVSKQINQICISAHPLSCKLSFKTSQTWAKRGGEDILNHLAPCVLDQWSCRTIDQKFVMTPPYPRSLCPNLRSPIKVILGHLRSC